MAHVTLYLDDDLAARLRAVADAEGLSQSRWVGELIENRLSAEWPRAVADLAGAWPDLPTAEEVRTTHGRDARRERL